ncbi:MAG: hypothetical protein P4M11_09925 [Candidatus Pacebacteria bacterium]|nr:hypothetical protein [Candidatus Paceibacterota bacterium]
MGFASQFKALFKKNIILWYRNLCGSLCELLFPIILLVIIVLVRNIIKNTDVSAQGYVNRAGFAYYYDDSVTVNTNPNYTSPVKLGLSAGNAFSACIQYNRLIFAFVGSNELYSTLQNDLFSSSGGISP